MGPHQRSGRRLSARPSGRRDRECDSPRLGDLRRCRAGVGQRPHEHQPRARDHGLHTVVKRAIGVALMLAAALVQVTWAPRLEIVGAFPNLVLLAVVAVTWTRGVRAGMAWACVGGVFLDLTAAGPIGPHALGLLTGSYLTGF